MRSLPYVLLLALLSPSLFAIDSAAVDKLARDTMTRWKIPAMAIAVVENDRVTYLKGFGATPDTLFQIGSTTKAFTTTAMAMLVDEKKMSWDDPVRKYVEYFHLSDPCADSLVTLRDIVSHRSGLSRHDELWDYIDMSRADLIRHAGGFKLTKPIRSAYQYNNIMFATAGEAVASASKMPWAEFVKTRIFEPLGMKNSVAWEAGWDHPDRAAGYWYDAAKDAVLPQTLRPYESIAPAGTIKSSARDLAQWVRFQLNDGVVDGKRLVAAETLTETKSPQTIVPLEGDSKEDNPETNLAAYGLGWRIQDYRGEFLVSHGGALNGFRTQIDLLPKHHSGFVVLTNLGRGLATIAMRNALIDMLTAKPLRDWNAYYLSREIKERTDEQAKKLEAESKRQRNTRPSHELSAYVGTYENPGYGPVTVSADGDRLAIQYGRLKMPLIHFQYDTFSAVDQEEEIDEQIVFSMNSAGDITKLTLFGEDFTKKS